MYQQLDETWNARAEQFNARMHVEGLPPRAANLSTIWMIGYTVPSRYNWMLQYYLRAEGLALSWVGTGRFIFSLDYTEAEFGEVADRVVSATRAMQEDGWWWADPSLTNKSIKRRVLREILRARRGAGHDSGRSAHPSSGTAAPSSRA